MILTKIGSTSFTEVIMKINFDIKEKMKFSDVPVGGVFIYENRVNMRVEWDDDLFFVDLESGQINHFEDDSVVVWPKPKANINLE
jgi:hypothetical protein